MHGLVVRAAVRLPDAGACELAPRVSQLDQAPGKDKLTKGRNDCFEYLKPSIELIESRVVTSSTQEPTLKELIDSYYNAPSH